MDIKDTPALQRIRHHTWRQDWRNRYIVACNHIFKVKEKQRDKKCLKCGLIISDDNV